MQVLVLQLRRTVWSARAGGLAKLSGARQPSRSCSNLQPHLSAAAGGAAATVCRHFSP